MRTGERIVVWRRRLLHVLLTFLILPLVFAGKGQASSPALIVTEFSDFQCPYCQQAAVVVEQLRHSYGDNVKFVFKQMPLPRHQYAFKAAQAAVIAQEQGKFWQYHDRLFAASDLSVNALKEMAAAVGLKQDEFNQALDSGATRAAVEKDIEEARQLGVRGTPTFLINGRIVRGAATLATLQGAIDRALTRPAGEELLETPAVNDSSSCQDSGNAAQGSLIKVAFTQDVRAATDSMTTDGVTLSPASINFSYQLVGTTSAQMVETVTNSGSEPFIITDISVSGRDHQDFNPTYSFSLPATVAPGNSVAINLSFAPALPGTRDARLQIHERGDSQHVPLTGIGVTCLGLLPACAYYGCADTDGDGLNDAWEIAGGIDFNNDGVVSPSEMVLTNVDPVFPDGTSNPHPSADPNVKDVFVKYDWMELADQLTNGGPTQCSINPLPSGPPNFLNLFYPYHSDSCAFDQACINGVCKGHSDAPDPAALKMVIDAFAAHNIRLHLLKGHALPHANVLTYGTPIAACTADLSTRTFLGAQAVDFYALKTANLNASYNGQNFSEAQLFPVFHYAVFGHRHACDSTQDCAKAACVNPDTGRNPLFNETGHAEQPGNDIIVSMGGFRDRLITPPALAQGGTFMHELGHNLGLNHGGPLFNGGVPTVVDQVKLNYKPNYLSVMNYNHQTLGISTADPNCAPSDYVCKTTPVSTRLDYSSFAPGVTPNVLDENNGNESAGLNLGNSDIGYTWCSGVQTRIPGTGPVDFNCFGGNMETWCASGCDITPGLELNKDPAGGGRIPDGTPGSGDQLQPFEDWPNLLFPFQCQPSFND